MPAKIEQNKSDTPLPDGLIATLITPPDADRRHVTIDVAPAAIFKILAAIGTVWLLIRIFPVLVLVALSLMLVATFNPLVRKWQAKLGRSWAIVAVVTALVLAFLGTLGLLIPPLVSQGAKLAQNAPHYTQQIQNTMALHHIHINVLKQVEQLSGKANDATFGLADMLSGAIGLITAFVTVAILTIYLLIEGPEVGTSLMRLLPRKQRLPARRLVMEVSTQVGGYMRGQIITSGLAGAFSFVTCLVVGVPNALALGALAAIADAIPLLGVLIALLPAALMALTVSPAKAGIVIVAYLVYHQAEDHFIAPRVYGRALGLSLSVIVISILVGVELMGMLGAVLALPVAAAIPSIIAFVQEWQEIRSASEADPQLP